MQTRIALFTDPLSATVSQQPSELQLELCEGQSDTFFHLMRIGYTKIDIDIQSIVHQQAKPQVSP